MIFDKRGQLSFWRVGLSVLALGALFIIGAVIFFYIDRAAHQVPLDVPLYTGAQNVGTQPHSDFSQTVFYRVENAPVELVAAHYQNEMNTFYGMNTEQEFRLCKRFPAAGNQPEFDAGQKDVVPYQFTCLFDSSGFYLSQYTRVVIQPGIQENLGSTMIAYEQTWQS